MIVVRLNTQRLWQRQPSGVWRSWPISSATNGAGNQRGSYCTPLGRHRIYARIGEGEHRNTAFRARKAIGIYDPERDDPDKDWILTRILWLEGLETGRNRRGAVDSRNRFIYIHGTHREDLIGTPASHGCIRMRADDLLQLFAASFVGERVSIRP